MSLPTQRYCVGPPRRCAVPVPVLQRRLQTSNMLGLITAPSASVAQAARIVKASPPPPTPHALFITTGALVSGSTCVSIQFKFSARLALRSLRRAHPGAIPRVRYARSVQVKWGPGFARSWGRAGVGLQCCCGGMVSSRRSPTSHRVQVFTSKSVLLLWQCLTSCFSLGECFSPLRSE